MIDQTILERIKILEPDYAKFVQSDFADKAAERLGEKANLSPEQITLLSNGITLFLLFFLGLDDFITFVSRECEISVIEAEHIVLAISSALPEGFTTNHAVVVNHLEQESVESEKVTIPATPVQIPVPTPTPIPTPTNNIEIPKAPSPSSVSIEIAEAEAALRNIPHIRTMAKDMSDSKDNNTQTYSSSQDSILNKK